MTNSPNTPGAETPRDNYARAEAECDSRLREVMENIFIDSYSGTRRGGFTQEQLHAAWERMKEADSQLFASRSVEDHILALIAAVRAVESSLNLGRLKFHELDNRIKELEPTPITPAEPTQSDYVFLDEGPDGFSAMGRQGKWVLKDKSSKPAPITAEELDNILEDWQTEDLEDLVQRINKRAGL